MAWIFPAFVPAKDLESQSSSTFLFVPSEDQFPHMQNEALLKEKQGRERSVILGQLLSFCASVSPTMQWGQGWCPCPACGVS